MQEKEKQKEEEKQKEKEEEDEKLNFKKVYLSPTPIGRYLFYKKVIWTMGDTY